MADPKITIEEAYEVFKNPAALQAIPLKSQGFVKSLLAGKAKYGSNSPKQKHWIRVYAETAQGALNPSDISLTPVPNTPLAQALNIKHAEPATQSVIVVGTALYAMLKKAEDYVFAKGGKKRPQIKFDSTTASPKICFKIAGKASKYQGKVVVTSGGQYGGSSFYGHIDQGGVYTPFPKATPAVIEFVVKFAGNPHKMGSAYGLATMHCCYCQKAIDTVNSKTMGYGPVCASKFGLPWGKKATAAAYAVAASDKKLGGLGQKEPTEPTKESKPSKWIKAEDAVAQMQSLAKTTGGAVTSVQGFAKAVAATGISEPDDEVEDVTMFPVTTSGSPSQVTFPSSIIDELSPLPTQSPLPAPEPVAQDFGFKCEVCMDTGKDLTPAGELVNCGSCK
jgi:hypothetical protein